MSQASTFTTMLSASTSPSPKSSICISSIIMEDSEMIDVAGPGSMSPLSAIAKAITKFLFGEAQLPASLSHFHAFFTGLATGAVAAPILYAFLTRNRADRGKIQLVVFHIMRIFQDRPDYSTLLQDPEKLLQRMESEVMHMVDKHLTMVEAGAVMKKLKRNYAHRVIAEPISKRIKRSPVEAPKVPHLTATYAPAPRGFLPAPPQEEDDEPEEVLQEAPKDKGKGRAEPETSPPPPPAQRGGFGLDYEGEVLYPPSPSTSDDDDLPAPPPAPYDRRTRGSTGGRGCLWW